MKKWSLLVLLLPLLFLWGRTPKQKALVPPAKLSTWSQFTEYKRLFLLLKGFGVETLLDIPCEDIQALRTNELLVKQYIGGASTKEKAAALQAQYGNEWRSFRSLDLTKDPLPHVDLVLCWDKLCTLPQNQVKAALLLIKKSGAKYLLMRHYPHLVENVSNEEGIVRPVNWKLPPYNLPEPIIQIVEGNGTTNSSLALWVLSN